MRGYTFFARIVRGITSDDNWTVSTTTRIWSAWQLMTPIKFIMKQWQICKYLISYFFFLLNAEDADIMG